MLEKMRNIVVEEEGQALTEYALILGLIVVGSIGILAAIGPKIAYWFQQISNAL